MFDFPEVSPGDPITVEIWNRARAAVHANRLLSGTGIRLKKTSLGVHVIADLKSQRWPHPFKVALSGLSATVSPGFVNGKVEPRIKGVSLFADPAPHLEFPRATWDSEGRSYIALEAAFDDDWSLPADGLTVIQCARFDSLDSDDPGKPPGDSAEITGSGGVPILDGRRARWPLAMLRKRKSGRIDLYQITFGDLQVKVKPSGPDSETGRALWV